MKNLLIAILLMTTACKEEAKPLPTYHTADFTPVWDISNAEKPHFLSDFEFTDQSGKAFGTEQLKGKIHVMNCFFTVCPSLCPLLMGNLQRVQKAFSNDNKVQMISLSVTPERDSVAQLNKYAKANTINNSLWHLLTGDKKRLYEVARNDYFVDENMGTELNENDFLHTENIVLVDQNLQIRGIYNGSLQLEMQQLIKDIETLKLE